MSDPRLPLETPVPVVAARARVSATLLAVLLAGLAMMGPFAIDTYLPAFPAIGQSLQATPIQVQQTLTAYMFSFGVMILWHGALSDAFGRRNIVIASLVVFAVATLGCAASHNVQYLWAFRVLQGLAGGAGVVIGRAIIRDSYSGAAAERLLSSVTMIFSIAPAIAPILGGWIIKYFDWRVIFEVLFFYTMLMLWFCIKRLPETLPPERRQPFSARFLFDSYKSVFRSPVFQLKSGAVAFNFAGLFLYVSSAPAFITHHLQLGPGDFGWLFVPSVSGIFFGALTANRLAGKISIPKQVRIGFVFLIGAASANVAYHAILPPALPWSVMPIFFYTFGMSLVAPGVTLLVLDLYPAIRGIVASCQSFTLTMLGALVAGVIAPTLSHTMLWLAAGQLGFTSLALLLWLSGQSVRAAISRRELNAWETLD